MHFPLAQVNSSDLQVSSGIEINEELRIIYGWGDLLQAFSSESSEQSKLSSHIHVKGMHSQGTVLHVNSSAPHTLCSGMED